jgi:DNA helicase-2/ATP-dependent DNA helicase PcrA
VLQRVLDEGGLLRHYANEEDGEKRLRRLEELAALLARFDNPETPARAALVQALGLAALGSDVERQAAEQDRVLILTVHQAKGLEFDTVFVAHSTDHDFPSLRSQREGRLDEEHRLFYVALSRARRRLYVTWPRRNQWGKRQELSRYAEYLRE